MFRSIDQGKTPRDHGDQKILIQGKMNFKGCYVFKSRSQGQMLCLLWVQWVFTLFTFKRSLFGAGVGLDCLQQRKAYYSGLPITPFEDHTFLMNP